MSLRIDNTEWISGALVIGDTGGGVLAQNLALTGDNGAGYLSDDVTLPADNGKEICGRITTWPAGLSLFAYEDGSVIASAADGIYVAQYQLYVDYVPTGSPTNLTFTFGAVGVSLAASWTEGSESVAVSGNVAIVDAVASAAWTEGSEISDISVHVAVDSTGAGRSKRKFQVETERGVIEVDSLDDVAELVRIAKAKREKVVEVKLEGLKVATPSTKPNIDYKAMEAKLRASIQAEMDDEDDILMLLL